MSELTSIENVINRSKNIIELSEAVARMRKNPDYIRIIEKGYLRELAADLVYTKTLSHQQGDKEQKLIDGQMAGIGHFIQYLDMIMTSAVTAEVTLEESENERLYLIDGEDI